MDRGAGILLPITSLPSKYGIGTMGKSAREFADFLHESGQMYWQILPIGPTGYGDSPYQSFSSFAGNPYWIDLDDLVEDGLLKKSDFNKINWGDDEHKVDYGLIYKNRFDVLKIACKNLDQYAPSDYLTFLEEEKEWLYDYALFMAIKDQQGGVAFLEWDDELKLRDPVALQEKAMELQEEMKFYVRMQYLFFKQWASLKDYVNDLGIKIIGDVPIYVSSDSQDMWANPEQFQLDEEHKPIEVAGCPPDGFAKDGQLWGNPLFDWDHMRNEGFAWWKKRVKHQMKLVDILRIDHFRGFESYYAIPYGAKTAKNGRWKKGPGVELFKELESSLGELNIIAEDLGFLTQDVLDMVKETGYPGMKVLQFAFDSRDTGSGYLPHMYTENSIVYAGTHDNDTILGWMDTAPKDAVEMAIEYLHMDKKEGYNWGMIRGAFGSVSRIAIMQMQDILGLGSEARMNIPATSSDNWTWRMDQKALKKPLAKKLYHETELYGRLLVEETSEEEIDETIDLETSIEKENESWQQ